MPLSARPTLTVFRTRRCPKLIRPPFAVRVGKKIVVTMTTEQVDGPGAQQQPLGRHGITFARSRNLHACPPHDLPTRKQNNLNNCEKAQTTLLPSTQAPTEYQLAAELSSGQRGIVRIARVRQDLEGRWDARAGPPAGTLVTAGSW